MTDGNLVMPLNGRGEKLLAENLSNGEEVLVKLQGDFGQALVLTSKRLYIVKWGFQAGQIFGGKCIAYEYWNLTALEIKQHLVSNLVQVLSPATQDNNQLSYWGSRGKGNNAIESDTAVTFRSTQRKLFQDAVNLGRQLITSSHDKHHTSPSPGEYGPEEQLQKLAELRQSGILTEDEFQTKKAMILDRWR